MFKVQYYTVHIFQLVNTKFQYFLVTQKNHKQYDI
jgi:hypothetical protein